MSTFNKLDYTNWKKYLILEGYRGSQAHGTYIPDNIPDSIDDIDTLGVAVLPKEYYLGLGSYRKVNEQYNKFHGKYDILIYEFKKFIYLLFKSNPNVMSLLWVREQDIIFANEAGKLLLENKELFLSKKMYKTLVGYAEGQLKKMTHFSFEGYMGEKRKKLVDKFGYDCKNASHCIRLLKMGIDLMKTGKLIVYRKKDKDEIISIKKGKWKLYEIKQYAEELLDEFNNQFKNSSLPDEPDIEKIEKLMFKIFEIQWKNI
jgi:predicted nucleotidyltransferase